MTCVLLGLGVLVLMSLTAGIRSAARGVDGLTAALKRLDRKLAKKLEKGQR